MLPATSAVTDKVAAGNIFLSIKTTDRCEKVNGIGGYTDMTANKLLVVMISKGNDTILLFSRNRGVNSTP